MAKVPPSPFLASFTVEEGVALLFGKRLGKAMPPPPVESTPPQEKTPKLPAQPETPNQQKPKVPPSPFQQQPAKQPQPKANQPTWEQGSQAKPAPQEKPKPVEEAKPVPEAIQEAPKQEAQPTPEMNQEEAKEPTPEDLYARPAAKKEKPGKAPKGWDSTGEGEGGPKQPHEAPADQTNPDLDKVVEKLPLPTEFPKQTILSDEEYEKLAASPEGAQALMRKAQPVGMVNPQGHYMAMQEKMVGISIRGVNFTWNPDGKTDETVQAFLTSLHNYHLPDYFTGDTSHVVISSQYADLGDTIKYGIQDLGYQSKNIIGTGGDGEVVMYRKAHEISKDFGPQYAVRYLVHEMTHNFGRAAFGARGTPGPGTPFAKASQQEGPTTIYAEDVQKASPDKYLCEDFAEAMSYYFVQPNYLKSKFPLKYKAIEDVLSKQRQLYNRMQRMMPPKKGETRPAYRPDGAPKFNRQTVANMIQQGDWHQLHDYLEETDPEGTQPILEWQERTPGHWEADGGPFYIMENLGRGGVFGNSRGGTYSLHEPQPNGENSLTLGGSYTSVERAQRNAEAVIRNRILQESGKKTNGQRVIDSFNDIADLYGIAGFPQGLGRGMQNLAQFIPKETTDDIEQIIRELRGTDDYQTIVDHLSDLQSILFGVYADSNVQGVPLIPPLQRFFRNLQRRIDELSE